MSYIKKPGLAKVANLEDDTIDLYPHRKLKGTKTVKMY